MRRFLVATASGLVVGLLTGASLAKSRPAATVQIVTLMVQGNNENYTKTGIDLRPNDRLLVQATGEVRLGGLGEADPWGILSKRLLRTTLWRTKPGALVARVGPRKFAVGMLHLSRGHRGKLELKVADADHDNNLGFYCVEVTVIRGTKPAPRAIIKRFAAEITGTISRMGVEGTIRRGVSRWRRRCYQCALKRNPGLKGKLTLQLVINSRGGVTTATVEDSTLGDKQVTACIKSFSKRWRFPPPKAGSAKVKVPLWFRSER